MTGVLGDDFFMREALKEAQKAYEQDEIPVGAVIVSNDMVIARGHNLTERLNDVTAHAEMQVITAAANYMGAKFLEDCTLYVTLEPCAMCAGALNWARIGSIVYGAGDLKKGYTTYDNDLLHPATQVRSGVLEKECGEIMTDFFRKKRD